MSHVRPLTTVAAAALVVLALAGCASDDGAASASHRQVSVAGHGSGEAEATQAATVSPTPSSEGAGAAVAAPASLPTSCDDVLPPAVGDRPVVELEPRAEADAVMKSERPVLAAEALACLWSSPGSDLGTSVEYSVVAPEVSDQYLYDLSLEGFACTESLGGQRCAYSHPGTAGSSADAGLLTIFERDGVVITLTEFGDVSGSLLQAVVHRFWP
jgi:hypothetical protein